MKALLELIKKLYGSKALSKTIGTRTNVITLPDKDTKRFVTNELNIDAASDAAVKKAFEDVEKLIPEIPKMNDQEILTLTGNLRRLDQRMNPPSAEVIEFGTKQPVSPAGIKQLAAEKGLPEDVDPNSPLGRIMQKVKQIELEGKDLAKEFGMEDELRKGLKGLDDTPKTTDELYEETRKAIEEPTEAEKAFRAKERSRIGQAFDDVIGMQKGYADLQREGMVRTAAREILQKNLKAGKLKLTDPTERKMILESRQGGVDPIEVFRREYGEGALEQLDDIADEILPAQSYKEITDVLEREKLFDLKPISAEQKAAEKASSEAAEKVMKDVREGKTKTLQQAYEEGELKGTGLDDLIEGFDDPDKFAAGGRVGYAYGSGLKLVKLLKDKGKTLTKAIQEAVDNIMPTGDKKLDADMAVDDMFENLGIDRDAVDQKDVLDAYDQAYQLITKPGPDIPAATTTAKIEGLKSLGLDPADFPDIPDDAISFASPKSQIAQPMSKEMIVSKYGDMIDDELMAKILTDDDPQRIAEVLATIDEAMLMQNKGMGSEEIISTIKKTPRTKQAGGGLAYLMGL